MKVIEVSTVTDSLVASIESRDVVLWVRDANVPIEYVKAFAKFVGLPWRAVFMERTCQALLGELENQSSFNSSEVRKRGFVQVIDTNPSSIILAHQCLPIYLLSGRDNKPVDGFEDQLRNLSMLNVLRESQVRSILVVGGGDQAELVPKSITDLWRSGFQSFVHVCSGRQDSKAELEKWVAEVGGAKPITLVMGDYLKIIDDTLQKYYETFPDSAVIVRMRQRDGQFRNIDLTTVDNPQSPISEHYELIQTKDLVPLVPAELAEDDFIRFFQSPTSSWKPYAAGVPWVRDERVKRNILSYVGRLNATGADDNCIAYIASESGAGGTTLARVLAWELARDGYPVLVAKQLPFIPDALNVSNFLNRAHKAFEAESSVGTEQNSTTDGKVRTHSPKSFETPWVILFDTIHWQGRDAELQRFNQELISSGRPVCILLVTGSTVGLSFYNESVFKRLTDLNHSLDEESTRSLGRHLNKFLKVYGKAKSEAQWNSFYQTHSIQYVDGIAAFWVTLSFWILGQYDLNETLQSWLYRNFKNGTPSKTLKKAILEIAAISSERIPLPEGLLISDKSEWPTSHLLEDQRSELAALGLVKVAANGERYWALVHDILGRFLINAVFFDNEMKVALDFGDAQDTEHLRLKILKDISSKPQLGEVKYRAIGEDFAKSIFKLDPNHGRSSFLFAWREALKALDEMPAGLRNTSRVFRHHSAISRRRIAKYDSRITGLGDVERKELLLAAITDIRYALEFIQYEPGSEPDINLYNSLANAYLDLAKTQNSLGEPKDAVIESMQLASVATRKAFDQNPTSPFVIETYVKHLLEEITFVSGDKGIAYCVEILGVIFSALTSSGNGGRDSQLQALADEAIEKLFNLSPGVAIDRNPATSIDVLINAWKILAQDFAEVGRVDLAVVSDSRRNEALDILSSPMGKDNVQILTLRYQLVAIGDPYNYKAQLELLEQIISYNYRESFQLRLEYAILLFQVGRAIEGDRIFKGLRKAWRTGEHYVQVPPRLRWLRVANTERLQNVNAETVSDFERRAFGKVREFVNVKVPFRVEEFGYREMRPGIRFVAQVSFGHNGPFLRPAVTPTNQNGEA